MPETGPPVDAPAPPSARRFERALIVDDSYLDRLALKRACSQAGLRFAFDEAASLADFSTALTADRPDLVFLDIHLGDGTGLDALRLIRSRAAGAPPAVVMVSDQDDPVVAAEAFKLGCHDYIEKSGLTAASVNHAVSAAYAARSARVSAAGR